MANEAVPAGDLVHPDHRAFSQRHSSMCREHSGAPPLSNPHIPLHVAALEATSDTTRGHYIDQGSTECQIWPAEEEPEVNNAGPFLDHAEEGSGFPEVETPLMHMQRMATARRVVCHAGTGNATYTNQQTPTGQVLGICAHRPFLDQVHQQGYQGRFSGSCWQYAQCQYSSQHVPTGRALSQVASHVTCCRPHYVPPCNRPPQLANTRFVPQNPQCLVHHFGATMSTMVPPTLNQTQDNVPIHAMPSNGHRNPGNLHHPEDHGTSTPDTDPGSLPLLPESSNHIYHNIHVETSSRSHSSRSDSEHYRIGDMATIPGFEPVSTVGRTETSLQIEPRLVHEDPQDLAERDSQVGKGIETKLRVCLSRKLIYKAWPIVVAVILAVLVSVTVSLIIVKKQQDQPPNLHSPTSKLKTKLVERKLIWQS